MLEPQPGAQDVENADIRKIDIGRGTDRAFPDVGSGWLELDKDLPNPGMPPLGDRGKIVRADGRRSTARQINLAVANLAIALNDDAGRRVGPQQCELNIGYRHVDKHEAAIDQVATGEPARTKSPGEAIRLQT